jgi:hypothetical protein
VPIVVEKDPQSSGCLSPHIVIRDDTRASADAEFAHPGSELFRRRDIKEAILRVPESPRVHMNGVGDVSLGVRLGRAQIHNANVRVGEMLHEPFGLDQHLRMGIAFATDRKGCAHDDESEKRTEPERQRLPSG